jgi:hypothetical protein
MHTPPDTPLDAEAEVEHQQARMLRRAFLVGAITDALALIPMLFPSMASLLWGFHDLSGSYRFAMGYGATLMLAWTLLLVWAYQRPVERRFVAALTVLVIYGLVATEVSAAPAARAAASDTTRGGIRAAAALVELCL